MRKPDGRIEVASEPLVSWAKRHRALRWPVVRGVVALVESLKIGFPGAAGGRERAARRRGRAARGRAGREWALAVLGATVIAIGLFFVVPVDRDQPDQGRAGLRAPLLARRGRLQDRDPDRLHRRDQPPGGAAQGLRVPRRRAQDDLLLRGGRRADSRARRGLLALPPALRHQLPADRDGAGGLRLRADRPARVVLAGGLPDPRDPADRRPLVRGHQVGRRATGRGRGCAP